MDKIIFICIMSALILIVILLNIFKKKPVCEKCGKQYSDDHFSINIPGYCWNCTLEAAGEAGAEHARRERERRINEMKEAIIRANKEMTK